MGERDFLEWLSGNDEIRVRIFTERGRVVRFTVQHEAFIDGRWYGVVRYDTSHGRAHRDTLDAKGDTIAKRWLDDPTLGESLDYAIRDIEDNWARYRDDFVRRMR